jgi:MoaA/NifB/PqqE/SkfB family radical SAM enzyme
MLTGEKEIVWDVVTYVNRKSINELPAFKEFLIDTGMKDWRIFILFSVGRAAGFPELQLSNENFTSVLDFIRTTRLVCHYHRITNQT